MEKFAHPDFMRVSIALHTILPWDLVVCSQSVISCMFSADLSQMTPTRDTFVSLGAAARGAQQQTTSMGDLGRTPEASRGHTANVRLSDKGRPSPFFTAESLAVSGCRFL
jgi:hypothetical protein